MIDLLKWFGAVVAASFAGAAIAVLAQVCGLSSSTAAFGGGVFAASIACGLLNEVPFRGRPS